MAKKRKGARKRAKYPAYRLRSSGVADREKFLRGCLAFVGVIFLLLFAALIWSLLFSPRH